MTLLLSGAAAIAHPQAVITYRLADGNNHLYRLAVDSGGAPEDLSAALDAISPGVSDEWINVSPDGRWLVLSSDRFDASCSGWECTAVVAADLGSGEALRIGGELIHGGFAAIASGGDLVVYADGGVNHDTDLWATHRETGGWSAPLLLTGASPYDFNSQPAISDDGALVVFDCGPVPYGQSGTAVCEVGTDGLGFRVVIAPSDMTGADALHHPDYAPDGGIVFESDPTGERIWRLAAGSSIPELVSPSYENDNSPCVLADGRIASLWLGRPGGGLHELKLMAGDGSSSEMLLIDHDIWDNITGCGGFADTIFSDGFESNGTSAWSQVSP
jgi:hypothetical protein